MKEAEEKKDKSCVVPCRTYYDQSLTLKKYQPTGKTNNVQICVYLINSSQKTINFQLTIILLFQKIDDIKISV